MEERVPNNLFMPVLSPICSIPCIVVKLIFNVILQLTSRYVLVSLSRHYHLLLERLHSSVHRRQRYQLGAQIRRPMTPSIRAVHCSTFRISLVSFLRGVSQLRHRLRTYSYYCKYFMWKLHEIKSRNTAENAKQKRTTNSQFEQKTCHILAIAIGPTSLWLSRKMK